MSVKYVSEASPLGRLPEGFEMKTRRIVAALFLLLTSASLGQVDIPAGYEIVEFAVDESMTNRPRINDCGGVVFVKDRFENSRVYLYDNGKLTRLTDYDDGRGVAEPDVNENGLIIWYRAWRRQPGSGEVVVFDQGEQTVFGPGSRPVLSDLEHMAWQAFGQVTCNYEQGIVFFDGEKMTPITDDDFNNQSIDINSRDWVTWGRMDSCVTPWVGDIQLYVESETRTLPSINTQSQVPTLNDRGQVAWFMGGIELWENGVTTLLTDWGGNPEINNHGDILFYRWHDELDSTDAWIYRKHNGGGVFHRLTTDSLEDSVGDINDWGEAVWRWMRNPPNGDFGGGVRFLRRIRSGDADFDGAVDFDDVSALYDCLTGPGRIDRLCDCRFLDIDHDGDVDLADFTRLQAAFARE
jgi:hypothetical protein